jgi:ribosome recycling factor
MINDVLNDCEDRMKKTVESVERELNSIRTGHAHTGLVEHVRVDYYGTPTPMNQLATVSAPEARLLTIQPWDKNALGMIEKALLKADIGLTPNNDGQIIRLAVPPLTSDRRKEMVKQVSRRVEEGKVSVRNVRRDSQDQIKRLVTNKEASEDEQRGAQDKLQKLTDKYIASIELKGRDKESELSEV